MVRVIGWTHERGKSIFIYYWVWKPEPNGQFSTRSAYCMLLEGAADQTVDEALEDLWQLKIPLKPTTFAW